MAIMTRGDFLQLFQRALNLAADNAEAKLKKPIPRSFLISLHAFGCDDRLLSVDDALEKLYLGSDRFFRIIDVAIAEVRPDASVVFVRPSGHPPDALSATWDPTSPGPFKQLIADKIVDSGPDSGRP
jgi:hypothetical protein